ncbi:hypothetical protein ACSBR2_009800 [Camellia fascicularis]
MDEAKAATTCVQNVLVENLLELEFTSLPLASATVLSRDQTTDKLFLRYFNLLQSECFSACFLSHVNMVISAPTGSGKIVLFELSILRLLSRFISAEGRFIHLEGNTQNSRLSMILYMEKF